MMMYRTRSQVYRKDRLAMIIIFIIYYISRTESTQSKNRKKTGIERVQACTR